MKKAALFFDIDGTLISNDTKEVPESAIRALCMAREKGHMVFLNTGRTLCHTMVEIKKIPADGCLCGCGTEILYQGEILMHSELPEDTCKRYLDELEQCNLGVVCEGEKDIYFSRKATRFQGVEAIKKHLQNLGMGKTTFIEDRNFTYDKVYIITDENSDVERFREIIKDEMIAIDRRKGHYECVQKGYSKATAIEYMRNYLGYDMDQIYVFGDSSNDLTMFEYAEHTVAMKKHDPVLDPYTEYVTDTVENDGVYKAMEHYGLI